MHQFQLQQMAEVIEKWTNVSDSDLPMKYHQMTRNPRKEWIKYDKFVVNDNIDIFIFTVKVTIPRLFQSDNKFKNVSNLLPLFLSQIAQVIVVSRMFGSIAISLNICLKKKLQLKYRNRCYI